MEDDRVLLRSGLLLQSLNDEHDWAYRYCVLTTKDGERSLLVFESAAAKTPVRTVALGTDATSRPFDAAEAQRLGSGGIVLKANDAAPETFWRALDEREAYDWRRALQANLHFDDTDQEGAGDALMPDACHGGPLLVWEIGRGGEDVRWQKNSANSAPAAAAGCGSTPASRRTSSNGATATGATSSRRSRPRGCSRGPTRSRRRASRSRWPTGGASPAAPRTCSTTRSTPGSRSSARSARGSRSPPPPRRRRRPPRPRRRTR